VRAASRVQSKVLTHPRSNTKSDGYGKSASEGCTVLTIHSYTVSTAVPWYMWYTMNVDIGAAQNFIVNHDAARHQNEYQCKINPWVSSGPKINICTK